MILPYKRRNNIGAIGADAPNAFVSIEFFLSEIHSVFKTS